MGVLSYNGFTTLLLMICHLDCLLTKKSSSYLSFQHFKRKCMCSLLVRLVKAFSQFDILLFYFIFILYEIGVCQLKQLVFIEHLRKAIRVVYVHFIFKYFDVYKCLPFQSISVWIKKRGVWKLTKESDNMKRVEIST